MEPLAIVVPLKSFAVAKSRLRRGGVSDVDRRSRELAARVIAAALPRDVFIACETSDVVEFAREQRANVILSQATSLNEAVAHSRDVLSADYDRIMVVHGDLSDPTGLGAFDPPTDVVIITDHRGAGTNVLVVPTRAQFHFGFGSDSAAEHLREAQRLDLETITIFDSPWRFDVDEPSDMGA